MKAVVEKERLKDKQVGYEAEEITTTIIAINQAVRKQILKDGEWVLQANSQGRRMGNNNNKDRNNKNNKGTRTIDADTH